MSDPDRLDRECHPEDEAVLREGIEAYFPEANGATRRMAPCMFTNTPDTDFVLDRYGDTEDVFVAAGFSGHGFKFCSVVGRRMADFYLDRPPRWGHCPLQTDARAARLTGQKCRIRLTRTLAPLASNTSGTVIPRSS